MSPDPLHSSDEIVELCAFRVGSDEYVVDIHRIREVVGPLEIRPVPKAPEIFEGVADLRGEVIPVVDVRRRLGVAPTPYTRKTKFLIAQVGTRVVALVVDAVCDVMRISLSSIRPAPGLAPGPRLFLGVCGGEGDVPVATGRRQPGHAGAAGKLRLLLNVRALLEVTS